MYRHIAVYICIYISEEGPHWKPTVKQYDTMRAPCHTQHMTRQRTPECPTCPRLRSADVSQREIPSFSSSSFS